MTMPRRALKASVSTRVYAKSVLFFQVTCEIFKAKRFLHSIYIM